MTQKMGCEYMQDRGAGFAFGGGCAHGRRRGSLSCRAGLKMNCNAEDGTQHVLHICKILSWVLCLGVAVRKVGLEAGIANFMLRFCVWGLLPATGANWQAGASHAKRLPKKLGREVGQEAWPRAWPRGLAKRLAKKLAKRLPQKLGQEVGQKRLGQGLAKRLGHEAWP